MSTNGAVRKPWGFAVDGPPAPLLAVALHTVRRNGVRPEPLADGDGDTCRWVRRLAECLARGECAGAVVFCQDACLACCVANKVPGIRAAAVASIPQARLALTRLGANLVAVEQAGRTYYEFKEILRLCCAQHDVCCPPGLACVLEELDGHAHR